MGGTTSAARVKVAGDSDLYGTIDVFPSAGGETSQVLVRLDDGRQILTARHALTPLADGSYELRLGNANLDELTRALGADAKDRVVIPLVAEEVNVAKRVVEAGRVRVTKVVREEEQVVDQPLLREEVVVERVPMERIVSGPMAPRQEGDVLVIPLVEEVLVVEKRLMLREEVRVSKRTHAVREPSTVTLRSEEARVERISPPSTGGGGTGVA